MADVKFFSEKKPSVFQPDADMEVKRRRRLAEQMIANSQQPQGTEIVSGMAVKQSPLAALARALQGGIGSYEQKQADQMDADAQKRRQDMMAQALGSYAKDPNAAAQMLGQDPNTSDMAFRIMQSELENRRRQEQDARNFAQQKEIMGMRADAGANGGNAPAAIQIMNEVQKRLQAGDTQGANMLMQIAKVYDKGVNPFDNMQAHGVQPQMNFQPIQNYGQAVSDIAGSKAAAIESAKTNVERMGKLVDESMTNEKTIPIIADIERLNASSPSMPYAGSTQWARRLLPGTSEAEKSIDLMKQARLDLAAPLAKQLGVNPTDKDFQASLDRIFDIDASKESRAAQIEALKNKIMQRQQQIGTYQQNITQSPQIAVNPQTGERLINRGNGWEPYNGQ